MPLGSVNRRTATLDVGLGRCHVCPWHRLASAPTLSRPLSRGGPLPPGPANQTDFGVFHSVSGDPRSLRARPAFLVGRSGLEAARVVAIAVVSPVERKGRQPGLAANGPALVRRRELVGRVQRAEVHFDLVFAACEHRRAATGTEEPPAVVPRFTLDGDRVLRKYCGGVKQRTVMLAAVEAVTDADSVRESRRHEADVAAQATTGDLLHASVSSRSPHPRAAGWYPPPVPPEVGSGDACRREPVMAHEARAEVRRSAHPPDPAEADEHDGEGRQSVTRCRRDRRRGGGGARGSEGPAVLRL